MSVSVETLAPTVTGRRIPPFRGGHGAVAPASGIPLRGGTSGTGGGSVGRLTAGRRGLDASHSWSPSPTSVVSGNRGRGGRDDSGGCSDGAGDDADDEEDDCSNDRCGRGMRPVHHVGDSAPARASVNGHHVSSSLSTLPQGDRALPVAAADAGRCFPSDDDPGGKSRRGWGLAEKEAAVGDVLVSPVGKKSNGWLPPLAPLAQVHSPARPVRPEPFAYARVPTEPARNGSGTLATARADAATGASPAGLLRGIDPARGAVGDTPPLHDTKGDRHVSAERSPLVAYPSAPEVMVAASPGAGNTKPPRGASRFLSAVASRVQVMAEHSSAVTAKRTRMGGALRRILVGVVVIFLVRFWVEWKRTAYSGRSAPVPGRASCRVLPHGPSGGSLGPCCFLSSRGRPVLWSYEALREANAFLFPRLSASFAFCGLVYLSSVVALPLVRFSFARIYSPSPRPCRICS